MAKEKKAEVEIGSAPQTSLGDQFALFWKRDGAVVFSVATGWGDRGEVETALEWFEAFKSPQKLFVYACVKWQQAVLEQIHAALLRYPYHLEGEQYLFMNLLGTENKMHLLTAEMPRNGPLVSYQPHLLRPLPGSPFTWRYVLVPVRTLNRRNAVSGTISRYTGCYEQAIFGPAAHDH